MEVPVTHHYSSKAACSVSWQPSDKPISGLVLASELTQQAAEGTGRGIPAQALAFFPGARYVPWTVSSYPSFCGWPASQIKTRFMTHTRIAAISVALLK